MPITILIERLAKFMAITGGLVLTALGIMTCISVAGRASNTFGHSELLTGALPGFAEWLIGTGIGPVNGDFEVLEAGVAFTIFAFLPICQLYGAHATVDIFTSNLPKRANAVLVTFWEIILTAVIILITWRLFAGLQGKIANGETTFILQFPVWWAYAASFVACSVAALVALYCAIARIAGLITGKEYMPGAEASEH